ncbi:MAG TPA: hypothetical protein VM513_22575 [Kofleriaceae bacterium]|nr:hypothetical protein [Kofleriaceae bacterium]
MKALILVLLAAGSGCGSAQKNKVVTDTEVLPYVAPDVDEIAGTDSVDDEEPEETPAPNPQPAQNPQK